MRNKLDIAAVLELSKIHVKAAQNLYKSQIEIAKYLHDFKLYKPVHLPKK